MHANYIRPGGLSQDIPLGILDSLNEFAKQFPSRINEIEDLLTTNRIWKTRLQGVGLLTLQKCLLSGFSGPMLRGSGAVWDLRKTNPYEIYSQIPFAIPHGMLGDCYDRYLIRIEELRTSIDILNYCLNVIPKGEVKAVNLKNAPSKVEAKQTMESTIQHFKFISAGLKLPGD